MKATLDKAELSNITINLSNIKKQVEDLVKMNTDLNAVNNEPAFREIAQRLFLIRGSVTTIYKVFGIEGSWGIES